MARARVAVVLAAALFGPSVPFVPAAPPVLNEFVARPRGEEGEWIEILNPGPEPVSLQGWSITDATRNLRRIEEPAALPAGGLLVLASRPDSLRLHYALPDSVRVLRPSGWPVLNDRDASGGAPADVIVLLDPTGAAADSTAYFESWLPPGAGESVERVDPRLRGAEPGAWGWSSDPWGATPGRPNSFTAAAAGSGCFEGPRVVAPRDAAALFTYDLPAPGMLAVWLLDRDGREVAVLKSPGPAPARGRWSWGSAAGAPPRGGLYFLCLRWRGESAPPVRCCRSVWVRS